MTEGRLPIEDNVSLNAPLRLVTAGSSICWNLSRPRHNSYLMLWPPGI